MHLLQTICASCLDPLLPVCVAAGRGPRWRCCRPQQQQQQQPRRHAQRQLHIHCRTPPPVGNLQRSAAPPHPHSYQLIIWAFLSLCVMSYLYLLHFLLQVWPPLWPASCPALWGWSWRNATKMTWTTSPTMTSRMMRATEKIWWHPEEAHARGRKILKKIYMVWIY